MYAVIKHNYKSNKVEVIGGYLKRYHAEEAVKKAVGKICDSIDAAGEELPNVHCSFPDWLVCAGDCPEVKFSIVDVQLKD